MYSFLDNNWDMDQKIMAAEFLPGDRHLSGFEQNQVALDRSRYLGAKYNMHDMDSYGMPRQISVPNEIQNAKKMESSQAMTTHNPAFNYITEDQDVGDPYSYNATASAAGGGFVGSLVNPAITAATKIGPLVAKAGPAAFKFAKSLIGPLISKGAQSLFKWIFRKKKGSGFNATSLKNHIREIVGKLGSEIRDREKDLMKKASSSDFWRGVHDHVKEGIKKVASYISPVTDKMHSVIDKISSALISGTKKSGAGLISAPTHKHIVGGGSMPGDSVDPEGVLRTKHAIAPVLENIFDRHLKLGLNSTQKQDLFNLMAENCREDFDQPLVSKIEGEGKGKGKGKKASLGKTMKEKVKKILRKVSDSPALSTIAGVAAKRLGPKIQKFASVGVDKLFDLAPEGAIGNVLKPMKEIGKSIAENYLTSSLENIGKRGEEQDPNINIAGVPINVRKTAENVLDRAITPHDATMYEGQSGLTPGQALPEQAMDPLYSQGEGMMRRRFPAQRRMNNKQTFSQFRNPRFSTTGGRGGGWRVRVDHV